MTSLDLFALAVFAISSILGLMRGLSRELLSLLSWFAAFYAAKTYSSVLAPMIPALDSPALKHAAALVLIFVAVLILASLVTAAIGGLIKVAGVGAYDNMLGGLFGAARGVFILLLLTVLAGLTALPKTQAWRVSLVHGPLEQASAKLKPWLPTELATLIQYH